MENEGTVAVEEMNPDAALVKVKRVAKSKTKQAQKDTPEERAKHTAKSSKASKKNPYAGIDHSDLSEDEKKKRGIETDAETEERVAKQEAEKKSAKKTGKAKKPAKAKAKAETKKPAKKTAKKAAKGTKKVAKTKAKPSDLGLTKAGTPRLKAEFDPEKTLGQKGPKLKLEKDELNDNEKEVLTAIRQARGPVKLTTLAEKCFPINLGKSKRNSRVRNALRRLIRASFVKKIGRGEFEAKAAKKAA